MYLIFEWKGRSSAGFRDDPALEQIMFAPSPTKKLGLSETKKKKILVSMYKLKNKILLINIYIYYKILVPNIIINQLKLKSIGK
jgi:hypothetical protein